MRLRVVFQLQDFSVTPLGESSYPNVVVDLFLHDNAGSLILLAGLRAQSGDVAAALSGSPYLFLVIIG